LAIAAVMTKPGQDGNAGRNTRLSSEARAAMHGIVERKVFQQAKQQTMPVV
jgi:hypothetical protein